VLNRVRCETQNLTRRYTQANAMNLIVLTATILFGLVSVNPQAWAGQVHTINPQTGAETWETHAHGVTFTLTQLLPDQVRAFYVNRGFTLEQIEPYALSCVYTAVLRNDKAPGVVHFILHDWSVITDAGSHPPMKTVDWLNRLKQAGAKKPALIAFRWAQFPPEHEYEPNGDWNQGMLATGLAAGSKFDVIARWDIADKTYEMGLRGVRCAK